MLFANKFTFESPIDVWIERVVRERYFPRRRNVNPLKLRAFQASYFGEQRGYAQQYLFHHARKTKRRQSAAATAVAASLRRGAAATSGRRSRVVTSGA